MPLHRLDAFGLLALALAALAGCVEAGPAQTSGIPNYDVPVHGHGDFESTPAGRIYYEVEGHGPALFLVAGGPGASHAGFHPWFSRLAAHHTLVYFDDLGRGRSDRLADPAGYTVARDVADIEALRQALHLEKISVLGQSYGGLPALAYALEHPEHIEKLVLSDTLLDAAAFQSSIDGVQFELRRRTPEAWEALETLHANGVSSGDPGFAKRFFPLTFALNWHELRAARRFDSGDPADELNLDVYHAMVGADPEWKLAGTLAGYDPRPRLGALRVPTLVCVGRDDRITPPSMSYEILRALPPGVGRMVVFERSGHKPCVEEYERYFDELEKFLDQN